MTRRYGLTLSAAFALATVGMFWPASDSHAQNTKGLSQPPMIVLAQEQHQGKGAAGPRSAAPRSAAPRSAGPRNAGGSSAGQRSMGQRSMSQRPSGQRTISQRPAGQRSVGPRPSSQRSVSQRPTGQRSVGQRPTVQRSVGQRPSGQRTTRQQSTIQRSVSQTAVTRSGHSLHGAKIRSASRVSIAGRNYSVRRGGYRVHSHGGWRTFAALSALGTLAVGGVAYYPYAYISAPAPYCEGLTEDGCQLQWQAVQTLEGPEELQCVAYCPWQ